MLDDELPAHPTIPQLQQYVAAINTKRGFDGNTIDQRFLLLMEEMGELARAVRKRSGLAFADDTAQASVEYEAADVFILLPGVCNMLGIDLEQAFAAKEQHNRRRKWKV